MPKQKEKLRKDEEDLLDFLFIDDKPKPIKKRRKGRSKERNKERRKEIRKERRKKE